MKAMNQTHARMDDRCRPANFTGLAARGGAVPVAWIGSSSDFNATDECRPPRVDAPILSADRGEPGEWRGSLAPAVGAGRVVFL